MAAHARRNAIFAADIRELGGVVSVHTCRDRCDGTPVFRVGHVSGGGDVCREIVLAAERLAALEEGARRFLKPIEGIVIKMAMGSTIASGLSLLGTGDPLREMREAALKDSIVTEAEIRKAQKL